MADDIVLGIKLTADGKELVGAVHLSEDALKKLREQTGATADSARTLNEASKNLGQTLARQVADLTGNETASRALYTTIMRLGLGFGAAAAAVLVLGKAYADGRREASEMNAALLLTSNYAGTTRGQMLELARTIADAGTLTVGTSKQIVTQIVASGQIGAEALAKVAALADDYAKATRRDVGTVGPELVKLFAEPSKGLEQLNKQYHFLSASQLEHIRQLEQIGELGRAQAESADILSQHLPKAAQNLGLLESAWNTVRKAASSAWDAMLGIGRGSSLEEQLADQNAAVNALQRQRFVNPQQSAAAMAALAALTKQKFDADSAAAGQAAAAAGRDRSILAQDVINRYSQSSRIAALGRDRLKLDGAEGPQLYIDEARSAIDKEIEKLRGGGKTAAATGADLEKYVQQLQRQLDLDKESSAVEKVLFDLREAHWKNATPELQKQALQYAKQLDLIKEHEAVLRSYQTGADAAERSRAERDAAVAQFNRGASESVQQQQLELELLGKSAGEQERLTALRKLEIDFQRTSANLQGDEYDNAKRIYDAKRDALDQAIQAKNAAKDALELDKERARAAERAREESERFWQGVADNIERSLTDSIMRGFENGEGIAKSFGNAVVRYFKTLAVSIPIKFISQGITGQLASAFPGAPGMFGGSGGGGFSLGSFPNPLSFLGTSYGGGAIGVPAVSGLAETLSGGAFASTMMSQTAAGIGGFEATLAATEAVAGTAGGAIGMGMSAFGPIGLGIGALAMMGAFGGSKKTPAVLTGLDMPSGRVSWGGLTGTVFGNDANQGYRWTYPGGQWSGVFSNEIRGVYTAIEGLARQMGHDPSGLRGMSASVSLGHFMGTEDALPMVLNQLTEQLARKVIPEFKSLAQAGESAAQTLARLVQEAQELNVNRMQAAIGLDQSTRDLWLSDLSPLTHRERLDFSRGELNRIARRAAAGDVDALNSYGGALRGYLGEASTFYGTSTTQYRTLFNARQRQAQGLVSDTLTESGISFVEMGGTMRQVRDLISVLPKALAKELEQVIRRSLDAHAKVREATQQAATREIVSAVSNGPGGPAWIDERGGRDND